MESRKGCMHENIESQGCMHCSRAYTDEYESKIKPGYHWECKYCDYTRGVPYPDEPEFQVCGRCGAEWEDCKILVPDNEQY